MINKNKDNLPYSELCHHNGPQSGNQRKQKQRQVLGPCQRTKKSVEHEGDSDTSYKRYTWNSPQMIRKGAGRVGN